MFILVMLDKYALSTPQKSFNGQIFSLEIFTIYTTIYMLIAM